MKYLVLLLLIIVHPSFTMDGTYRLPSHETITQRLKNAEFHHFTAQSGMADLLADSYSKPVLLHGRVSSILAHYNDNPHILSSKHFQKNYISSKHPTVADLMGILLQDYPGALTALEKNYDGHFRG